MNVSVTKCHSINIAQCLIIKNGNIWKLVSVSQDFFYFNFIFFVSQNFQVMS